MIGRQCTALILLLKHFCHDLIISFKQDFVFETNTQREGHLRDAET